MEWAWRRADAGVGSKRALYLFVAAVALIVAAIAVLPRAAYALTHETTDDAYVDTSLSVITARHNGTVTSVFVNVGDFVKRGRLLAQMDSGEERLQVAQARQSLAIAQAALRTAQFDEADTRALQERASERITALESQAEQHGQSFVETSAANTAKSATDEAQLAEASAAVRSARAAVPAAQIVLSTAKERLQRLESLQRDGYVALNDLERARTDEAQAQAAYAAATSAYEQAVAHERSMRDVVASDRHAARSSDYSAKAAQLDAEVARTDLSAGTPATLEAKRAEVARREAEVEAAKRALETAQYRLGQTELRAPVDGYVAARPAGSGQTLQVGDPVVVVAPDDDAYITANFKESQLAHIRPGAEADVHVDALPIRTIHATVVAIGGTSQAALSLEPHAQAGDGNFIKVAQRVPVRLRFADAALPRAALRSGMSVEVSVQR